MWMLRYFARNKQGSAAIEFAMVATPFLAMLLAGLQIFLLAFAQQNLETAAEAAGRLVLTGNASALNQSQFKTAVCQQLSSLFSCNNLMVDVETAASFSGASTSTPTITYDQYGNVSNTWNYTSGSPGSVMVLRLMYLWPMFNLPGLSLVNQNNGTHLMMATSVFKNEAY